MMASKKPNTLNSFNSKKSQSSLTKHLTKTFAGLALVASLFVPPATWAGKDLSELSAGTPALQQAGKLPDRQYVAVEVRKLAKPVLVWVNLPALREMGFDVPDAVTPEVERKILDAVAWVTPDDHVSSDEITSESRTFYTDFYGGKGIGVNHGSARAASSGYIQSKGVGITPMQKHYDANHTARSTIHEAIKDAVWGEVLSNELPYRGNRLVAILTRGDSLENGEPQVIEVRIDPTRTGHFITRTYGSDVVDIERTKASQSRLLNALPQPATGYPLNASPGRKIVLGLLEYARRVGIQYAHMYMKRFYHGATSQSNIEISGRMIDFGTASSQPGYEKIQFLDHILPFGDTWEISHFLISSFASNLSEEGISQGMATLIAEGMDELNKNNPRPSTIKRRMELTFANAYEETRNRLALTLTGVPPFFVKMLNSRHHDLGQLLVQITEEEVENSEIIPLKTVTTLNDRPTGRLQELLRRIHNLPVINANVIEATLADGDLIADVEMRKNLSTKLAHFFADAERMATAEGLNPERFRRLIQKNFLFSNRPAERLYLPSLRDTTKDIAQKFMQGDIQAPARAIREISVQSLRTIDGLSWFEAPVSVSAQDNGEIKVTVYNAWSGHYSTLPLPRKLGEVRKTQGKEKIQTSRANLCSAVFQL